MQGSKIRWTGNSWNPVSGCVQLSPGCDHCYALTFSERQRGTPAFPFGFDPRRKENHLHDPTKWKTGLYIFVNSMSDLFLGANEPGHQLHVEADGSPFYFGRDYLDEIFDEMLRNPQHVYQILTKRPRVMLEYLTGRSRDWVRPTNFKGIDIGLGYLERRGLDALPDNIWPGTTIESDAFTWRAKVLRRIPATNRMISAEPLLGPLPSLDLTGITWLIVGGESGPGFRTMDLEWARELRAMCADSGTAFYFKQSSAIRTEMGIELDGERVEEYPPGFNASGRAAPVIGRLAL